MVYYDKAQGGWFVSWVDFDAQQDPVRRPESEMRFVFVPDPDKALSGYQVLTGANEAISKLVQETGITALVAERRAPQDAP